MRLPDPHEFPRSVKLALYAALDAALVPLSLILAHALRYGTATPWPMMQGDLWLFAGLTLAGGAMSYGLRLNTIRLRVIAMRSVLRLAMAAALLAMLAVVLSYLLGLSGPRSVPMIFATTYFFAILGMRLALQALDGLREARRNPALPVAIYGAGSAGLQLAAALDATPGVRPRFFIDDNRGLQGLTLAGLPVYPLARLDEMARRHDVRRVLLAMPTVARSRQADLTRSLGARGFEVQVLPSYADMMTGLSADPVPVAAEDVMARDSVALDAPAVCDSYAGRVVMVTGAAGRIGSELCRQLLQCRPARIVLLDQNEAGLAQVTAELGPVAAAAGTALSARLGNVTHRNGIVGILRAEDVQVVFHTAAYRNIPFVESNALESARNNVLGAQIMADCAEAAGVARFVLVSSNKTPNSDSIMSATRNMAELVVLDLAARAQVTRFCVVRLANVLGHKGALLPLIQRQIQSGGPVTLPHPDATRLFVTLPEAARLVLVGGAMAQGGEAYLLDPGAPRKLLDIAESLIRRSGRRVRAPGSGEGDVEIRFTGLRPGESLCDPEPARLEAMVPTTHPRILRAEATRRSQIEVAAMLRELSQALDAGDTARLRALVSTRLDGFSRDAVPAATA